ncbi:hypothetical protein SprV_0200550100 [Sparganum proliferum]
MVEKLGQIHASTVLVGPRPPALPLPLCTKDAYEDFEGKLNHDADFREEVMKQLVSVGGRNNREFVRNNLNKLLGPPLCRDYCWSGSVGKQSFVGSPLYALLCGKFSSFVNSSDAIRLNPTVGGCGHEMVRKTVINWFHGSRDRYGGRAKRRETIGGTSEDTRCPTLPPSEDTEPAVDAKTSSTPN